jgi:alkylation response protein AidB-like acyl-CoA dehydrogenase
MEVLTIPGGSTGVHAADGAIQDASHTHTIDVAAKLQQMASFAVDLMEQGGVMTDPQLAPMAALFQQTLMTSPSSRIAGGSDEIMRNIIAERVLGLPPEVRVDKGLPFNKLPTGKT